MINPIKPNLGL